MKNYKQKLILYIIKNFLLLQKSCKILLTNALNNAIMILA